VVDAVLAEYLVKESQGVKETERYIGSKQKVQDAVNDRLGISVATDSA
jgi:hypothetical protein